LVTPIRSCLLDSAARRAATEAGRSPRRFSYREARPAYEAQKESAIGEYAEARKLKFGGLANVGFWSNRYWLGQGDLHCKAAMPKAGRQRARCQFRGWAPAQLAGWLELTAFCFKLRCGDTELFRDPRVLVASWVNVAREGLPGSMRRSEEYRRYAAECLNLASALQEPEARALMRHMAQVWVRLAQDAENRSPSPQNKANQPG
jgi:hypothetical protein